jgi:hypothetical protein
MSIVLDTNARDGKSTKAQRLKTAMQVKLLIYLAKTHIPLVKKEWW